jgi:G2/mitotic-specific cyclin-B, other
MVCVAHSMLNINADSARHKIINTCFNVSSAQSNMYHITRMHYCTQQQERNTPTMYMHTQSEINPKMRSILIDWLVEVHLKFKLNIPTLYLASHLLDRYCMLEQVTKNKLQLVGITALLIASKYEEIYPPDLRDCVYITDSAYTREEVLGMEAKILKRLNWQISVSTIWTFMCRILKIADATSLQYQRACYYSERSLQEHDMLAYRPSMIAAAAVYLARLYDVGEAKAWTSRLDRYCNISLDLLLPCSARMLSYISLETVTNSRR